MGFYTIYIDDSGTCTDACDQLFLLQAALVPADSDAWSNVESVCLSTLEEIRKIQGLEIVDRIHMVDMFQRSGVYKHIEFDQVCVWIERVLRSAKDNGVLYVTTGVLHSFRAQGVHAPRSPS